MVKKKIITVSVRNKIADGCGTELVSDNSDYRIRFDLDSDWDGINAKTARLLFGTGHYDFPFTGNEVDIDVPIPAVRSVTIGLYAGDVKTSTPAFFKCRPSVKSSQSKPTPPPPEEVYNKIMALIDTANDAIKEVEALPTEDIEPNTFYRVGGKLFYRVGDEWSEIHTEFFDYVNRGEYEAAIQSVTDSLTDIGERVDGKLTEMGERLKATDDKAVVAHNKAVEVNAIANNALNISSVALQSNRDEVQRATEAEGVLRDRLNSVEGLAKGANQAVSFGNYQTMITAFNSLPIDAYNIGQNVMIVTLKVPDLWVSEKSGTSTVYNYTSDEDFKAELDANGSVQIGYYILSALETQKVDIAGYPTNEELNEALSAYVKSTDYATEEKAGVVKVGSTTTDPLYADDNGDLHLGNDNALIDQRSGENAIRNQDLDYAIKVGLTTNGLLLTDEEKGKATEWLGTIKKEKTLDSRPIIYGTDESGKQVIFVVDPGQSANSMVKRDGYGGVYTASAKFGKHAVNLDDLNAKTKGGVGEWIEATSEAGNHTIQFTENGVYEYVVVVFNIEGQGFQYSNTFIYDKSMFTDHSAEYLILLNSSMGSYFDAGSILVQPSSNETYMLLVANGTAIFKARKIRDI